MFILISEKEVEGVTENQYNFYYKTESIIQNQSFPIKTVQSQKSFKNYTPVPLKKFNHEIIPSIDTKTPLPTKKSIRKFKF